MKTHVLAVYSLALSTIAVSTRGKVHHTVPPLSVSQQATVDADTRDLVPDIRPCNIEVVGAVVTCGTVELDWSNNNLPRRAIPYSLTGESAHRDPALAL